MAHAGHQTSSLKFFRDALDRGLDSVQLFSNEEWILEPLIRYASNAGLTEEEALFNSLRRRVQETVARAIRFRKENAQLNAMPPADALMICSVRTSTFAVTVTELILNRGCLR